MTRPARVGLKVAVWLGCLGPLAAVLYWFGRGDLTANPISFVTNTLGDWTFRLLLASLAMTPLRIVTGLSWPVTLRRLLGLFAFFYASLHFLVWIAVDHFFDWAEMGRDIVKRPYITVGMSALLVLVPLAITSTRGMVKRLGGRRWRRLHQLVYAAGILASLHFFWLAKVGREEQYVYAAVLAVLLGIRGWDALRRAVAKHRPTGATVSSSTVPRRVL